MWFFYFLSAIVAAVAVTIAVLGGIIASRHSVWVNPLTWKVLGAAAIASTVAYLISPPSLMVFTNAAWIGGGIVFGTTLLMIVLTIIPYVAVGYLLGRFVLTHERIDSLASRIDVLRSANDSYFNTATPPSSAPPMPPDHGSTPPQAPPKPTTPPTPSR